MKAYSPLGLVFVLALGSPLAAAPAPPLPVGAEIAVNAAVLGSHTGPRPALFADGSFVVVWNDTGARTSVHARFFAPDGSPAGGEFRLLAPSDNYQAVTAVVVDRNDSFLVAWDETPLHQPTRVFVQRFRRDGRPAWPAVQVNAGSPRQRFGGLLALVPGGGFVVGWTGEEDVRTHTDDGLYIYAYNGFARVFTAGGTALGPEFLIAEGRDDQAPCGLAIGPDRVLTVLYTSWGELYYLLIGRRSLPGDPPLPDREDLSVPSDRFEPGSVGVLSQAPDGSLTVAWTRADIGDNVFVRRFAVDGSPRTGDVQVNVFHGGGQLVGDVAALPDGGFVVVWTDYTGRDGSGAGIFARAFGADNQPLFPRDFRVNQTILGSQDLPRIAGRNGRFVVGWTQSDKNAPSKARARLLGH